MNHTATKQLQKLAQVANSLIVDWKSRVLKTHVKEKNFLRVLSQELTDYQEEPAVKNEIRNPVSNQQNDVYIGEWDHQTRKKDGYGIMLQGNCGIYQGQWSQDLKHGPGRLIPIHSNKKVLEGDWSHNVFLFNEAELIDIKNESNQQEEVILLGPKLGSKDNSYTSSEEIVLD
mmetsp:Transcript_24553/g.28244  ORF Transcript_24553/g.28244 Transcript_24553/m.28244 type:complete len:173 (-) Transcript_24553:7-525(-)